MAQFTIHVMSGTVHSPRLGSASFPSSVKTDVTWQFRMSAFTLGSRCRTLPSFKGRRQAGRIWVVWPMLQASCCCQDHCLWDLICDDYRPFDTTFVLDTWAVRGAPSHASVNMMGSCVTSSLPQHLALLLPGRHVWLSMGRQYGPVTTTAMVTSRQLAMEAD